MNISGVSPAAMMASIATQLGSVSGLSASASSQVESGSASKMQIDNLTSNLALENSRASSIINSLYYKQPIINHQNYATEDPTPSPGINIVA